MVLIYNYKLWIPLHSLVRLVSQITTGERVEPKITDALNTCNKQGKSCYKKLNHKIMLPFCETKASVLVI